MNRKQQLFTIAGLTLLAACTCCTILLCKTHHKIRDEENIKTLWSTFKNSYNKKYADPDFEQYRIEVFTENLKIIDSNCQNFGITKFMDLTQEEFKQTYLTLKTKKYIEEIPETVFNDSNGDIEIDWTMKGAVTPVKDQGKCGSCWSFSTTGAVEGAHFLSSNELVSLSEQYLIDCSKNGNEGCNGGLMDTAFDFIAQNGIPTENAYPYKALDGTCKMTTGPYKISSYQNIISCNDLLSKLQKQPIAIAVDANNFQFYTKGIFSKCGKNLDHGVLLVGYSSKDKFWKVKNSWGSSWGEDGYIRLSAGNTCGLCNQASYPIV
ncbi:papain family cysteine protease (macronuclear) [Tetrahymena thermophila SB210]|uniref:cathepsin L n=1 Tax=Tetrahymena thermophila (strain SB210) TaxID=312017 RepID=Q239L5_TETTS|nr:papain family cysteine protease [Tetrahymena thermophila SB210]EAR93214.1 papain family cysteine protease [Tetrahymena thermophila SB210]|eukprot:XP_001013459.1 papain family cysteine protease [Tetrahymena thermophila SB210]